MATKIKFAGPSHHPTTDEIIYENVYQNKTNPGIRGAYIGTGEETKEIHHIFKDWDFVYTAFATPRSFEVYKDNNYSACWGQEREVGKDFVLQETPEIESSFTDEDIFCDRYTITDTMTTCIVISINKEPAKTAKAMFMGRCKANKDHVSKFIDNGYKPIVVEYRLWDYKDLFPV